MNRKITLDLLRLVAAFGVVLIHVKSSTAGGAGIGRFFTTFCVPFFFMSAIFFSVKSFSALQVTPFLRKVFYRLFLPYLTWTILYSALLVFKKYFVEHGTIGSDFWWRSIFYGESAVQLYFMPNLIAVQLFAFSTYDFFIRKNLKLYNILMWLGIGAFYYVGIKNNCFGIGDGHRLADFLVFILFAFCMTALMQHKEVLHKDALNAILLLSSVLFLLCTISDLLEYFIFSPIYVLAGISTFLIGFYGPSIKVENKLFKSFLLNSFGIYLSHVLFLEMFEFLVLDKSSFSTDALYRIVVSFIVFMAAGCFVLVLRKMGITRKLFLGE